MIKDGIESRITKYKGQWRYFRFKRANIEACLSPKELKEFDSGFTSSTAKEEDAVYEKLLKNIPLEPDDRKFFEKYPPAALFLLAWSIGYVIVFPAVLYWKIISRDPTWSLGLRHIVFVVIHGYLAFWYLRNDVRKMFNRP